MKWMLCPMYGRKTHNEIRKDTELKNFPLYCPKCRQETLINTENMQITIIQKQKHYQIVTDCRKV